MSNGSNRETRKSIRVRMESHTAVSTAPYTQMSWITLLIQFDQTEHRGFCADLLDLADMGGTRFQISYAY